MRKERRGKGKEAPEGTCLPLRFLLFLLHPVPSTALLSLFSRCWLSSASLPTRGRKREKKKNGLTCSWQRSDKGGSRCVASECAEEEKKLRPGRARHHTAKSFIHPKHFPSVDAYLGTHAYVSTACLCVTVCVCVCMQLSLFGVTSGTRREGVDGEKERRALIFLSAPFFFFCFPRSASNRTWRERERRVAEDEKELSLSTFPPRFFTMLKCVLTSLPSFS